MSLPLIRRQEVSVLSIAYAELYSGKKSVLSGSIQRRIKQYYRIQGSFEAESSRLDHRHRHSFPHLSELDPPWCRFGTKQDVVAWQAHLKCLWAYSWADRRIGRIPPIGGQQCYDESVEVVVSMDRQKTCELCITFWHSQDEPMVAIADSHRWYQ